MALLRASRTPADLTAIAPLGEHPEHVRLSGLRRALMAGVANRQGRLDLDAIEMELARPAGTGTNKGQRGEMLRQRAMTLRLAVGASAEPAPAASDGLPAAVTLALSLLQGERRDPPPDRQARLSRARSELEIFTTALSAVEVLLDELKAEQSLRAAKSLLPQHRAALVGLYRAAESLAAAATAERAFVVALINAGYDASEATIRRPGLAAASRLGTPEEIGSEISFFRQRLQDQGISI